MWSPEGAELIQGSCFYLEEENRHGREINGLWGAECMCAGLSVPNEALTHTGLAHMLII